MTKKTRVYQKEILIQKETKREMVGEAFLPYNQIPLTGEPPTDWKIIISQKFSHRSRSSKTQIRLPSIGILALGKGGPGACGLQDQQGLSAGLECRIPQDSSGKRDSIVGGCTKFHVHWDPEHQTCLWVLEGFLGKQGAYGSL